MSRSDSKQKIGGCYSRRAFLFGSGATVAGTIMLPALPGMGGKALAAQLADYPRKEIGRLSKLKLTQSIPINYPDQGQNSTGILVKLGEQAGGGIGPDRNVVAFNTVCTHMGGDMSGVYKAADSALGPCPLHQSSFDLTRHGMIIAGHATESLPQLLLELEGDRIFAVGMIGLIYGRYDNLKG